MVFGICLWVFAIFFLTATGDRPRLAAKQGVRTAQLTPDTRPTEGHEVIEPDDSDRLFWQLAFPTVLQEIANATGPTLEARINATGELTNATGPTLEARINETGELTNDTGPTLDARTNATSKAPKKSSCRDRGVICPGKLFAAFAKHKIEFYTQAFPRVQKPHKPYNEKSRGKFRGVCVQARGQTSFMNCDSKRFGIGRGQHILCWIGAIVAPFAVASLIIHASAWKPRTCGKLDVKTGRAFTAMLVSQAFAIALGRCCFNPAGQTIPELCMIPITLFAMASSMIATFWFIDIEFQWPDLFSSVYIEVISCIFSVKVLAGLFILMYGIVILMVAGYHTFDMLLIDLTQVYANFIAAIIPRNIAFLLPLYEVWKGYTYAFYFWDDTTGDSLIVTMCWVFPNIFLRAITFILCFATPYSRDRYFIAAFSCLLTITMKIGLDNANKSTLFSMKLALVRHETWGRLVEVATLSFLCCVAMRFQIVLPDQLQKVRYLRLGYIYDLRRNGQKIARCQELPESAFGNPAKVIHMIIISHHWIDGHTCDKATLECPQGLRLTTMCQRLEQFFPFNWPGFSSFCSRPISSFLLALRSATYSSYDCLVFWDFASLPQIGMQPDGTLIQRTPEEQALFKVVLPAAGLLYTMFPVMVCPEVTEDVTPYMSSGWCFCEWEQSQLCGTLSPYSTELQKQGNSGELEHRGSNPFPICASANSSEASHSELLESIQEELKKKLFRCEEDREIVRDIVRGTFIRRELVAAVRDQSLEKVQDFLKQLKDHGLESTISFPVDSSTLDSLLHVAKRLPLEEIQIQLISHGADEERPNHRGEEPGFIFLFPRSWFPCLL